MATAAALRPLKPREKATFAGDVRANENIALTATHTLFAREHNRLVKLLPTSLSEEERFQIARLLHELPQVTIAAVRGGCAGAALGWAMACDFRLASEQSVLNTAFLDVALVAAVVYRFVRRRRGTAVPAGR